MSRDLAAIPTPTLSPPSPHVLFVVDAEGFARFGFMFRQLGLGLNDQNVRCSLLTDDPAAAAELDGSPLEPILAPALSGWRAWSLARRLDELFARPPSAVHLWGVAGLPLVSEWSKRYGISTVLQITSAHDVEQVVRRGSREELCFVALCDELAEMFSEQWPGRGVAPIVIHPALLSPESAPPVLPSDTTLGVVWAGRLEERCGLSTLIDALGELRNRNTDVQLALIGDGPYTGEVWQHIRRRKVAGCVSLVGEPRLWEQAMHGADVCVVPACQTEVSLPPLLAMSLSKVVVASRDQIATWFVDGKTAWLFSPGSVPELTDALMRAARRDEPVKQLTESAARYVRSSHALPELARNLAGLYERLQHGAVNTVPRSHGKGS